MDRISGPFKQFISNQPEMAFIISVILSAWIAWSPVFLSANPLKSLWFGISIPLSAIVYASILQLITKEGVDKDFGVNKDRSENRYSFYESYKNIEFSRLTYLLNLLNSRIGAEYDDIAGRVGWLVTSQAFLVAGLMQVLNAEHMEDSTRRLLSGGITLGGVVIPWCCHPRFSMVMHSGRI